MKILIRSPRLREYFRVSWSCLPPDIQSELGDFIREVRQVPKLEGTVITEIDGSLSQPLPDGFATTHYFESIDQFYADIILAKSFTTYRYSGAIIAPILYFLASIYDRKTDPDTAKARPEYANDLRAWERCEGWLLTSSLDATLKQEIGSMISICKLPVLNHFIGLQKVETEPET